MAKHVCDICFTKLNSDESYELHMLRHTIEKLIDAVNYLISLREEQRV